MSIPQFRIAVLPGDGIGPEVMDPALHVLAAVQRRVAGFRLSCRRLVAGAAAYRKTGTVIADEVLAEIERSDAVLLGAMGLPDIRRADGTEIAPQLELRSIFDLYAGVRPIRLVPGVPSPLADPRAKDIDFVILRESTEGLFADREHGEIEGDARARDALIVTRPGSERLFAFAFALAERRKARGRPGRVACVDKANVLRSMVFFRKIFDGFAAAFPGITAGHRYVDAMALDLVRRPWDLDVLVTENMFGDILSDLGAGLIGGMGMAPSADIGDHMAVFQPSHGSAPDIAGQGVANPTAMILSAAMMLDWLGERHGVGALTEAAAMVERAVDETFRRARVRPREFGGADGTTAIARAIVEELAAAAPDRAAAPMREGSARREPGPAELSRRLAVG
jgi:3-isopropylmalate dehydrogenase